MLIAVTTTCNLNSVFPLLVAVATEEGGLFSHTALLARELGIPAVVGAPGLLGAISDGDVVEVDPTAGVVRVISRLGRYRRRMPVVATKAKPYNRIRVAPLTGALGAEVSGVQLRDLDDETMAELHDAWLEHKVLFFRDQQLTRAEHVAYGRGGSLEQHPFVQRGRASRDRRARLDSREVLRGGGLALRRHVACTARHSGRSSRGVVIPPVGGDTCWANMELAYEQLPDRVKDQIEGKLAVHSFVKVFGRRLSEEEREQKRHEFPDQLHPVVRTHPETGRKSLYVNQPFTMHIEDMEPDESERVLEVLYRQASVPQYQCRFRWQPDSVAQWDNRCTQHYAVPDFAGQHRRMERVTIEGDRPR